MTVLRAFISPLMVYGILYVIYRRKSGGRMEGYPGALWALVGGLFMSAAAMPAVNGGSREVSLIGGAFFLVLFSFLAFQRFQLKHTKMHAEDAPEPSNLRREEPETHTPATRALETDPTRPMAG